MSDRLEREIERAQKLLGERHALMKGGLIRDHLVNDPMQLFSEWFDHAHASGVEMPETMTLATLGPDGVPSIRNVSMRGRDETSFHFYTNYDSTKGRGLHAHPYAAVLFNWLPLRRQVKVNGRVERASRELSDAYFGAIPRPVRLRFIASEQSKVIRDRAEFEERLARIEAEYAGREVPRPEGYGAFRLIPSQMEFWQQGYQNFLGDRFLYTRIQADAPAECRDVADTHSSGVRSSWKIDCLAP